MKYHVIWCPKYRRRVLVGPIERLFDEDHCRGRRRIRCCGDQVWPSWLIATVGGAPVVVVGRCVENQKVAAARTRAG